VNAGHGSPAWLIVLVLVLAGVMGLFVVFPIGFWPLGVVVVSFVVLAKLKKMDELVISRFVV
jgi:hypothetical protein